MSVRRPWRSGREIVDTAQQQHAIIGEQGGRVQRARMIHRAGFDESLGHRIVKLGRAERGVCFVEATCDQHAAVVEQGGTVTPTRMGQRSDRLKEAADRIEQLGAGAGDAAETGAACCGFGCAAHHQQLAVQQQRPGVTKAGRAQRVRPAPGWIDDDREARFVRQREPHPLSVDLQLDRPLSAVSVPRRAESDPHPGSSSGIVDQ